MTAISEAVTKLLLTDRQEDSELPVGQIDHLVARQEITVKEMAAHFERELQDKLDPMA